MVLPTKHPIVGLHFDQGNPVITMFDYYVWRVQGKECGDSINLSLVRTSSASSTRHQRGQPKVHAFFTRDPYQNPPRYKVNHMVSSSGWYIAMTVHILPLCPLFISTNSSMR